MKRFSFILLATLVSCTVPAPVAAQSNVVFSNGFENKDFCDHPLVTPYGWVSKGMTWEKLFTPRDGAPVPRYPNSNGFPVPIGAERGGYTVASFTAVENQTISIFWDPAQAKPSEGYFRARPANGMFIGISPCFGDLRAPDNTGGFLMTGCRKFANTGGIVYSTKPTLVTSTLAACKLEAGTKYYFTIAPLRTSDGLTVGESECSSTPSSELGCDVQARSTRTN